ncbi:MAG: UPF0758 domain-containing protein [Spirochaetota bacterium]
MIRGKEKKGKDSGNGEWHHAGGKLRELGAENLTDAELLSILIATGIKGKSAEKIAEEIINRFGSYDGMGNQPLEKFLIIKGLSDAKIIRIAAALEIARRCVHLMVKKLKEDTELHTEIFGE